MLYYNNTLGAATNAYHLARWLWTIFAPEICFRFIHHYIRSGDFTKTGKLLLYSFYFQ